MTVVARSSAAGMAIGLGYQTGAAGGFPGTGALPDAAQAAVVLAVYTAVLGGVAYWLFERRDVQGATGGG